MRIKHYQGYGSVNARVIKKGFSYGPRGKTDRSVTIEVSGNHEYGIIVDSYDHYRLAQWLGKLGGFKEEDIESFDTKSFSQRNEEKGIDEDHCIYTVRLKNSVY